MKVCVRLAGEELLLLPDRAAFWARESTLFVADVHFGKAAAMRADAIPVPSGTTGVMLHRLSLLLVSTKASRLVLLGDLWHAKRGRAAATVAEVAAWRSSWPSLEVVLVEGNHDRRSGPVPPELGVDEVGESFSCGPFVCCHHPPAASFRQGEPSLPNPSPSEAGGAVSGGGAPGRAGESGARSPHSKETYTLCGHIHPCVSLIGKGRAGATLPCFWFGPEVGVLPAFGEFTGCGKVHPASGDRVFVLADGKVMDVSPRA